jgi:hypothetical protein
VVVPVASGNQSYSKPLGSTHVGGSFPDSNLISGQPWSTGLDFSLPERPSGTGGPNGDFPYIPAGTINLNTAALAAQQGRTPAIGMMGMLFNTDRSLRSDASAMIDEMIQKYPSLMALPNLKIEVVDEIFWNQPPQTGLQSSSQQLFDVQETTKAISLLRAKLPNAKLGLVINPESWGVTDLSTRPPALDNLAKIVGKLNWVGVDPYFFDASQTGQDSKIASANYFSNFIKSTAPSVEKLLIAQSWDAAGQYPNDPNMWTNAQIDAFNTMNGKMFDVGQSSFDTILLFGYHWTLDATGPKNLPQAVIDFFNAKLATFAATHP